MSNLILSIDPQYMHDSRLDLLDKIILSYVSTWEKKRQVCFAKDDLFYKITGEPENKIRFSLAKLETLNLLAIVRGNGGRVLTTIKSIAEETPENVTDIFDGIY